ncbi:MAG: anion-transporting ArsA/GET3 family ATPase, partial [Glaciecola sp.]
NFEGMYEGFKERADAVLELLQDPDSRFVIVASPEPPPLAEAKFFLERMEQEGLRAAGVVVNRTHPEVLGAAPDADLARAAEQLDAQQPALAGVLRVLADTRSIAERERREVESALYGRRLPALVEVPLLRGDVHDLETLASIAETLAPWPTQTDPT